MKMKTINFLIGLTAILIFYDTIGIIAAGVILNAIANQTHNTATIFDTWWQIVLFVVEILLLAGLGFLIFYKIKLGKRAGKGGAKDEKETQRS